MRYFYTIIIQGLLSWNIRDKWFLWKEVTIRISVDRCLIFSMCQLHVLLYIEYETRKYVDSVSVVKISCIIHVPRKEVVRHRRCHVKQYVSSFKMRSRFYETLSDNHSAKGMNKRNSISLKKDSYVEIYIVIAFLWYLFKTVTVLSSPRERKL